MTRFLGSQARHREIPLPFREAVQVGDIVYLSGQLAFDASGNMAGDDIESQTLRCVENIGEILAKCGLTVADVFKVTAYLVKQEDFAAFNAAFAQAFGANLPVRSTVRCDLVVPGALVELEVAAYLPVIGESR